MTVVVFPSRAAPVVSYAVGLSGSMLEVVEAYTCHLQDIGMAQATVRQRRWVVAAVARTFGDVRSVTPEQLQGFIGRRHLSPESRRSYRQGIRHFYGWLGLPELAADLVTPKVPRHLPRPMTDEQVALAMAGLMGHPRLWFMLAVLAGLRCCEIAAYRAEHLYERRLLIPAGKGGHAATVPAHVDLVEQLRATGVRVGPIWEATANQVSCNGNRALRRAGVDATMHQARHYFGTEVYRECKDLRVTQELMRHTSPLTTAGYTLVADDALSAAVNALRLPVRLSVVA